MRSRLFTQQVVIAALFAAIAGLACYDPSGLRGDGDFNRTLQMCKRASKVEIFEGLPHQMFEPELLAQEQQRSDVFKITNLTSTNQRFRCLAMTLTASFLESSLDERIELGEDSRHAAGDASANWWARE